jgi:hypothetical protein
MKASKAQRQVLDFMRENTAPGGPRPEVEGRYVRCGDKSMVVQNDETLFCMLRHNLLATDNLVWISQITDPRAILERAHYTVTWFSGETA